MFLTLPESEGMKWYSGLGKWGIELWVTIGKGKEVGSQSRNVSIPILNFSFSEFC